MQVRSVTWYFGGRGRVCRGGGESGEQDEGEEAETRRESGGHWEETGRDCVIRTFAQEIGLRASIGDFVECRFVRFLAGLQ